MPNYFSKRKYDTFSSLTGPAKAVKRPSHRLFLLPLLIIIIRCSFLFLLIRRLIESDDDAFYTRGANPLLDLFLTLMTLPSTLETFLAGARLTNDKNSLLHNSSCISSSR